MKNLILSVLLAALATGILGFLNQQPGRHWFDPLLWPPLFMGTLVSGNAHSPSEVAFWISLFIMLVIVAYIVLMVISMFSQPAHDPGT